MKTRKLAGTLALLCLIITLLTGSVLGEKVTIKAVIWGGQNELEVEQQIAEEFNRLNPHIELVVESYGASYNDKILVETAGAVGPDVMLLDSIAVPFWVDKDLLIDLKPYLERDEPDFLGQFFPNVIDAGRVGDRLYAIPKDFTPQVLYYNRRAFDLAGITEPEFGWTWEEFLEKAPKLTSDEPRRERYAAYFSDWIFRWINWVWCLGGEVLGWENGQLMADGYLNSKATTEAIGEFIALKNDYRVAISSRDVGILGVEPLLTGRCALWGSGHWWLVNLRKLRAFKPEEIRVVNYPVREQQANLMAESGFAMTVNTKHPDEAWEVVKWLTGPFAQSARAESGLAISANIAIAQDFAYADPIEEGFLLDVPFMKVHVIEHPSYDQISGIIDTAIRSAAYDGKALGPALEIAAEQVDMVIKDNPWSPYEE